MDTVLTIIVGLLVLTVLVIAHEWGHYIVGRLCHFRIEEFAAGMGPKIVSRVSKKNGIRYSLRALPIGGFVQFYGEDEEQKDPAAFNSRPKWQRALTLAAGPFMNVVVAFLLTVVVLTCFGDYTPVVRSVEQDSPAYAMGIREGDTIVSINGQEIDFMMEVSMMTIQETNGVVDMVLERDGEEIAYDVPTMTGSETGGRVLGIGIGSERRTFGFFEAIGLSFKWLFLVVKEMFEFLGDLIFRGQGADQVAGPVGTISLIGSAIRSGPEMLLRIGALLSLNLGIMNILPFPALDGGRLVFVGIEAIRGKPISRNKEGYINFAGLIVLFGLMIVLTYQDIARLIAGG